MPASAQVHRCMASPPSYNRAVLRSGRAFELLSLDADNLRPRRLHHARCSQPAVHNHENALGHYPTAGNGAGARTWTNGVGTTPVTGPKQEWGWMYQILPYLEQSALWATTTGANGGDDTVKQTPVKTYFCPSRR